MQKGESSVFKGLFVDLSCDMWYAEYVGAAEKPPIFCSFLQLAVVEKIQYN